MRCAFMPKINVLGKQIAELIAAGEVVERPSSVVKELVENSIDAGSKNIEIEIRSGGKDFIRITDDGCGIERDDMKNAFLRHATSKVKTANDLDSIKTLGFRGEALASICAVSRVEIVSRVAGENEGSTYNISASEGDELSPCGCPCGTTIIVKDLFYNTPARMKFLKKDVSEANAIASLVDRIALSHPEIAFRFIRDDKEVLSTTGDGDVNLCIYHVYGREFANDLIKADFELNNIKVSGYISKPKAGRPNRNMQHFFINGRYIKSKTAMAAVEQAFKGSLMVGKFPSCVLYIDIAPEALDVNIHPAKLEIRFINEKPLFEAVYSCVKDALRYGDTAREFLINPRKVENNEEELLAEGPPKLKFSYNEGKPKKFTESQKIDMNSEDILERKENASVQGAEFDSFIDGWYLNEKPIIKNRKKEEDEKVEECLQKEKLDYEKAGSTADNGLFIKNETEHNTRFIGEVFNTYILVEYDSDQIMFIDKHAAHEALLFKRLKDNDGHTDIQVLISPKSLTLEKNEYAVILENKSVFENLGFELEDFGRGTILVRGIPMLINANDAGDCIIEIAQHIGYSKSDVTPSKMDKIYHSIACKAAIRGGDITDNLSLINIAKKLLDEPDVKYCPHGRPVSIMLKKSDIEKQFGRT